MEHKIIFAGSVGAGKTTAISAISDIPIVNTDAAASDEVAQRKPNTTVAMDYGVLDLGEGAKVHLYGTPGQERFSFMWEILTVGGLGLVLLIDNAGKDPVNEMAFYLKSFESFIARSAVVIGITRMDVTAAPTLESYDQKLAEMGLSAPVFEIDARRRSDVQLLLQTLLAILDPGLKR